MSSCTTVLSGHTCTCVGGEVAACLSDGAPLLTVAKTTRNSSLNVAWDLMVGCMIWTKLEYTCAYIRPFRVVIKFPPILERSAVFV